MANGAHGAGLQRIEVARPNVGWWVALRRLLYPSVREPVSVPQWRRLAGFIAWLPLLFAVANLLPWLTVHLGWSTSSVVGPRYGAFLTLNLPGHGLAIAISLGTLRWARSEAALRRYGAATVLLLGWGALTGMWGGYYGIGFICVCLLVASSRIGFDSRLGAVAFATGAAGVSVLALLGAAGLGSPQLAGLPPPGRVDRLLGWVWEVTLLFTVWLSASWVAMRFRRSEHALALERAEARWTMALTLARAGSGRLTGTLLAERYRLEELLGRGGMGEVYAARRLDDDAELAVKVMHPHLLASGEAQARFVREADTARRLPGSYVPAVFDVGVSAEGEWYIVMERLRGEDLACRIRRLGRLPLDEVLALVDRLAAALDALHAAGIVHRDLKPQNVFLLREPPSCELRLLDLGVARLIDGVAHERTATGVLLGSPGYLSPEQVTGSSARVGPPADVFALGAIVYRALTGQDAFPAREVARAVYEAVHHHPPAPTTLAPELPPDVDAVLTLALAKDLTERYAAAGELARDLERAGRGALAPERRAQAARLRPRDETLTSAG